ncbi:hypothetical protein BCR42DRAFT_385562 [Absidia repens]|uniref:Uncharacterized protein n=1 Tax=Absidia repens TaxID=90262 RepID=A0A1X2HKC5_9FUNG|nr:hypothetical protein BCR42DRAFT_385562 [Absidia repens]
MFHIVLREGITGGFVGPTVKQVVEIHGDDEGATIVHANLKPSSKTDYTTQQGQLSTNEVQTLVNTLVPELGQLPIEEPIGSEDIYGFDTSISFLSGDFKWQNGGPEGCTRNASSVQASPEQKQTFQKLVQTLTRLGQQNAIQSQD